MCDVNNVMTRANHYAEEYGLHPVISFITYNILALFHLTWVPETMERSGISAAISYIPTACYWMDSSAYSLLYRRSQDRNDDLYKFISEMWNSTTTVLSKYRNLLQNYWMNISSSIRY